MLKSRLNLSFKAYNTDKTKMISRENIGLPVMVSLIAAATARDASAAADGAVAAVTTA